MESTIRFMWYELAQGEGCLNMTRLGVLKPKTGHVISMYYDG